MNDWHEVFTYSEGSPSGLVWKQSKYLHVRYKAGQLVGTVCPDGYWRVMVNRMRVHLHRCVYEMFYGKIPDGKVIDHIDGNRKNNVISNLRLLDKSENTRNCKKREDNTSGETGVYKTGGKWVADWRNSDGKRVSARFSVTKYGYELAYRLAVAVRKEAEISLLSNIKGYTTTHGRRE